MIRNYLIKNQGFTSFIFFRFIAFFGGYLSVLFANIFLSPDEALIISTTTILGQGVLTFVFWGGNVEAVYQHRLTFYFKSFLILSSLLFFLIYFIRSYFDLSLYSNFIVISSIIYAFILFFEPVFRNTNFKSISHLITARPTVILSVIFAILFNFYSLDIDFSLIFLTLNIFVMIVGIVLMNKRKVYSAKSDITLKQNSYTALTSISTFFLTQLDLLIIYSIFSAEQSIQYFLLTRFFGFINLIFRASNPYFSTKFDISYETKENISVFGEQLKFNLAIFISYIVFMSLFYIFYLENIVGDLDIKIVFLYIIALAVYQIFSGIGYLLINLSLRWLLLSINLLQLFIYIFSLIYLLSSAVTIESLMIAFIISSGTKGIVSYIIYIILTIQNNERRHTHN